MTSFGQSNMHAAGKSLPILAIAIFLSFPIAMGLANTLLVLLLVAWLLSGAYKERWITIRANPVAIAALLLYCVILVGALYSTAPINDILLHFNKYSKLLFAVILICVLTERKWQQYCLNAYTVAMLFILASTWLNIWFLLPWSKSQELGWGYSHHVVGDYITQNVMMSFFVLLSLVYAYNQKNLLIRLAWAITAIMGAVSITHLSRGRTGYVLLVVALLIFLAIRIKGKMKWLMLAPVVLGFITAISTSDLISKRIEQAVHEFQHSEINNQSSIGHRLYNYKKTIELIKEKPLLGWGTGAYHEETCRILENPEWCEIFTWHPHNQFLFFGADHGMLGILAYLLLISSMIWVAMRDDDPDSRTLLLGLAALLAVNSLFNSPLWSSRENHFFLLMMGLLGARSGLSFRLRHSFANPLREERKETRLGNSL